MLVTWQLFLLIVVLCIFTILNSIIPHTHHVNWGCWPGLYGLHCRLTDRDYE